MNKIRLQITKKVRELRLKKGWSQAKLAELLELSQNRLSEIERGQGSFTAEHLVTILKTFNIPLDFFVKSEITGEEHLQNLLTRLGAGHLQESTNVLPTERIKNAMDTIREVIVSGKSPRLITALAPVIVQYAEPAMLNQLRYQLTDLGFFNRYAWLLENTLTAIARELSDDSKLPKELKLQYRHASEVLQNLLGFRGFNLSRFQPFLKNRKEIWGIDEEIKSKETFREVQKASSKISKKWGIVTRLQPEDFVEALKHARKNY